MNTDNMSILGLTIDYGPYGWLEGYDPAWTPNTTDAEGRRYCYGNQPHIAQWNLARLAEALLPVVPDQKPLEEALTLFADTFNAGWQKALAAKLGVPALDRQEDDALVKDLLELFRRAETDFTLFFRNLARVSGPIDPLLPAFYAEPDAATREAWEEWLKRYLERTKDIPAAERRSRMDRANPKYVFRNYLAQLAIDAIEQRDDTSVLERLMRVLERPYDEQPEHEDLAARRPEWARHRAGCSALSCSS
jgi:uncharacterized protein YdiU (UPF0061 family)